MSTLLFLQQFESQRFVYSPEESDGHDNEMPTSTTSPDETQVTRMSDNVGIVPWDLSQLTIKDTSKAINPFEDESLISPLKQFNKGKEPEPTFERPLIEVCPGVRLPLRGSKETLHALQLGKVVNITCLDCDLKLYCIQDAEHVLCPDCKSISPNCFAVGEKCEGVGLGFDHYTANDLLDESSDIEDSQVKEVV